MRGNTIQEANIWALINDRAIHSLLVDIVDNPLLKSKDFMVKMVKYFEVG